MYIVFYKSSLRKYIKLTHTYCNSGEGEFLDLASIDMQHIKKIKGEGMQQMSTKMQHQIEWRRAKVMELLSKGESNQSEIARILQVDKSIICRDISYLRNQAKANIKRYISNNNI